MGRNLLIGVKVTDIPAVGTGASRGRDKGYVSVYCSTEVQLI